jgi:hypothetical protein
LSAAMSMIQIDWDPPRKMLRSFGFIGVFAFGGLAALAWMRWLLFSKLPAGAVGPTAWTMAGLGVYCGVMALAAPGLLRPLYLLLSIVGYPIGLVVSLVVMAVLYFLVITPIALVFKAMGRDAMNRKFDPALPSYWIRRRPPASVKRYYRQF